MDPDAQLLERRLEQEERDSLDAGAFREKLDPAGRAKLMAVAFLRGLRLRCPREKP
jgi:hypothetical protein